jgi:hypothetical protein
MEVGDDDEPLRVFDPGRRQIVPPGRDAVPSDRRSE